MKRYIILLTAICFSAVSCSLKEEPTSFPSRTNYYNTRSQCIAALNGCYLPAASIYCAAYMLVTEACTDIWHCNSSTVDASLDVTPAKPQFASTMWPQAYQGVMRCNECIECIGASPLSEEEKRPLIAEAVVLRALYYYNLTCMFNGVPFYTCMVKDEESLKMVRRLPRTNANDIRSWLYNDLKENAIPYFTAENGLLARASEIPDQRVGYALALMLMGKMAMWNQDWEGALVPLKLLEELYGEFNEERYPLDDTMWSKKNTMESIFEVQHAWSVDGVQFQGNVSNIMMPTSKISTEDNVTRLYDGVPIPFLGNQASSWSGLITNWHYGVFRPATGNKKAENTSMVGIFNPVPLTYSDEYDTADGRYYTKIDLDAVKSGVIRGKKIDRRVYYNLSFGNLETGETFVSTSKRYGLAWAGKKFWCPDVYLSNDSNNYKIFRYADALLMMAECYLETGDTDNALKYINIVRARAAVDPIDNNNGKEGIMAVLRCERARELGGEFQRKFDLVRWGIWYQETKTFNPNTKLIDRIKPCHRYYPIPDTECALSGYVLTNDEYVKEGM